MEISSEIVGTELAYSYMDLFEQSLMTFAAATYDLNPVYVDDTRHGGIVAPPMYTAALNCPVIKSLKDYFHFLYPALIDRNFLLQSEHIVYKRLFKPDDQITVKGKVAALLPHQRGAKLYMKFDYVDEKGRIIQTEYNGAILLGVYCRDTGLGEDELPNHTRIDTPSALIWDKKFTVPQEAPYIYANSDCVDSTLHTSKLAAKTAGMQDVTLQGSALLAYTLRELIDYEIDGEPEYLQSVACEFVDSVQPGVELRIRLLKKERNAFQKKLWFDVLKVPDGIAITDGFLTCSDEERKKTG